jgi:glycyl-tRNA synthetase alpha subunit
MKDPVFWEVVLCNLVEVYRRFRGACYLHPQAIMEAASSSELSINFQQTTRLNNPEDSRIHEFSVRINRQKSGTVFNLVRKIKFINFNWNINKN